MYIENVKLYSLHQPYPAPHFTTITPTTTSHYIHHTHKPPTTPNTSSTLSKPTTPLPTSLINHITLYQTTAIIRYNTHKLQLLYLQLFEPITLHIHDTKLQSPHTNHTKLKSPHTNHTKFKSPHTNHTTAKAERSHQVTKRSRIGSLFVQSSWSCGWGQLCGFGLKWRTDLGTHHHSLIQYWHSSFVWRLFVVKWGWSAQVSRNCMEYNGVRTVGEMSWSWKFGFANG